MRTRSIAIALAKPGSGKRNQKMYISPCGAVRRALWAGLVAAAALTAQPSRNFLQSILGTAAAGEQPMLSADAPRFSFAVANRAVRPGGPRVGNVVPLDVDGNPVRLELEYVRRGDIDVYRIRHAPNSPLRGEQVKVSWTLPRGWNESMTLDAGALQGQPLYLPNGNVPDNQFTNWGTIFYHRRANIAVGTQLRGAEMSRHARRGHSRYRGVSTFQLMTLTGHPEMEITFFAYRPSDERFWWAEAYQLQSQEDATLPENLFPILSPVDMSWAAGERQEITIAPGPGDAGREMELAVIDEISSQIVARVPFTYQLPVTRLPVTVGDWPASLYRIIVVEAGRKVDPSVIDLDAKLINVFVRPERPSGDVLFVAPTDMWFAYSTNGGHDYHGWRTGYDGSIGYAPTVMSSRRRRLNHFYYSLYDRYNDIHHFRFVDEWARGEGVKVDYATQHDIALGRVSLDDYKLVLVGNHCEFTTEQSYRRFSEYLGRGGAVMIHGGDSFAVMVEYLPSIEKPRYIWQKGHVFAHLSDAPSEFRPPVLLPAGSETDAPIVNPDPGDAVDYLNVFHNTVGYWVSGMKAVVSSTTHPIMDGLGLRMGDEVPGPWGGEVDIPYEPHAWEVLIRSDKPAPEGREFGIDAFDPTPFHRTGLAVHRNLRLGFLSGENFPNILADKSNTRYRAIYASTLRHYLRTSRVLGPEDDLAGGASGGAGQVSWDAPVRISAARYELPAFIDFERPGWYLEPAPYAHYVIEGSNDGQRWFLLADRSHGPWRGLQTDFFPAVDARHVRFRGTFSNGRAFRVKNIRIYRAK